MLFAGWQITYMKICYDAVGLGQHFKTEVPVFHHTNRPLAGK